MPTLHETIAAAEGLLQRHWGPALRLDRDGEVLSEHGWPSVVRAAVADAPDGRQSVIIKTYRSYRPYDPDDPTSPASELFAEWAGSALLAELVPDEPALAGVVTGDRELGVVVIDDLGSGPSLDDLLAGGPTAAIELAFDELARVLASVHGAILGQLAAF